MRKPTSLTAAAIVAVFLALRLWDLGAPLLEMHSIRQAQTAMFARNIMRDSFKTLSTRIDWEGTRPGYFVLEFPAYEYIVAAAWRVFGSHDVIGRLLSMAFALMATWYLFRIAQYLTASSSIALWTAAYFAICPIAVFVSRAFLVNMMALALSLAAIYYWLQWLQQRHASAFIAAVSTITLGTLVNLTVTAPAIMLIGLLALNARGRDRAYYRALIVAAVVFVLPNLVWNLHAAAVNATYYADSGAGNLAAVFFSPDQSRLDLYSWFRIAMYLGYFVVGLHGSILVLLGLRRMIQATPGARRVFGFWCAGGIIYVLVFFTAIRGHNYYTLPIVPIIALAAGYGAHELQALWRRRGAEARTAIVIFALTLPVWLYFPLLHSRNQDTIALEAAEAIKAHTKPADLVVVTVLHSDIAMFPTVLYYADRRGWSVAPSPLSGITADVERRFNQGASYVVVTFGTSREPTISSKFPLFRYFSHETAIDPRPVLGDLQRQYETVDQGPNHVLLRKSPAATTARQTTAAS